MMKIGFIGSGQMAKALATGMVEAQPNQIAFSIHDPSRKSADNFTAAVDGKAVVTRCDSNQSVFDQAELVFLAVKPQYLSSAIEGIAVKENSLVVSIVAGATIWDLARLLKTNRIIRVMPNTPCLVGRGASGIAGGEGVTDEDLKQVRTLLEASGIVVDVPERLIDSVTGVSGSGPAYVFTFIEALIDGGVLVGLHRDQARELAIQTVLGAAQMLVETDSHPGVLRDQVTSPGGTTIAALKALEETGFRDSVMSAVVAATEKAVELGGQ